ncbi:MAG: protein TolQ [Gammaproteobacteria bacterium]|jgi:biopolymer transport protein TolQ|nr:protein TolQ [Gammaproteobacteria bacterium]
MSDSLSLWNLILNASWLAQLVMLSLFLISVMSWVIIVQKWIIISDAEKEVFSFEKRFWSGMDLSQLYRDGSTKQKNNTSMIGMENLFRSGFKEFTRLRQQPGIESDAVMEGAGRAMRVALAREEKVLERHLPILATVASVSVYLGLFGTVWGIMNTFVSLANQSQASLAVVAPGIADALLATEMGLFAAIPAAIAYNRYAAKVDSIIHSYMTFTDEFSSILHRQAHTRRIEE